MTGLAPVQRGPEPDAIHVLDTGAVFVLLNKHRPALLETLKAADRNEEPIWIPSPVLVEVGQAAYLLHNARLAFVDCCRNRRRLGSRGLAPPELA